MNGNIWGCKREAAKRSDERAAKTVQDMLNRYAGQVSGPDRYLVGPPFEWKPYDLLSMFPNDVPKPTKQQPKHNRKAAPKVKKTQNEDALDHAQEAKDYVGEAQEGLRAADALQNMRVYNVATSGAGNEFVTVTIYLQRIDNEKDKATAEDCTDQTVFWQQRRLDQNFAARLRGMMQEFGRSKLVQATLSLHRLVKPELDMARQQQEAQQASNSAGTQPPVAANSNAAVSAPAA